MVHVTPAPNVQQYCRPVSSVNIKKLGAFSTNPLRLTKKGPLSKIPVRDGEILEDVEQMDSNVFRVDVADENGRTDTYTIIVPDPVDDDSP